MPRIGYEINVLKRIVSLPTQKYQLERINIHDSKRATYDHTKKCVENLIYLGQTDRAVQLLLETESENEHYYADCIK